MGVGLYIPEALPYMVVESLIESNWHRRNGWAFPDAGEAVGCNVQLAHQAGRKAPDTIHDAGRQVVPNPG
jgi:hypothetical protein